MTWEDLIGCARERLTLTEIRTRKLETALVKLADDDDGPGEGETVLLLTLLTTSVGDLHRACESLTVGLDALMIMIRELTTEEKTGDDDDCPF